MKKKQDMVQFVWYLLSKAKNQNKFDLVDQQSLTLRNFYYVYSARDDPITAIFSIHILYSNYFWMHTT